MAEIKDVIKDLVRQCNIESISTKDLTKELTTLYGQVETLENKLKSETQSKDQYYKDTNQAREDLAKYKASHVDPVEKLKANQAAFDREKFKFDVEKEFCKRETEIYRELVKSMTATRNHTESWYGGNNGGNYSKGDSTEKPQLPTDSIVGKTQLP